MTDMDEVNIGLPYELAMADEESRREFYASAQALLASHVQAGADHTALWFRFLALETEAEDLRMLVKEMDLMFGRYLLGMRASVVEWQHGKDAAAAMQWIWNGLAGPGELPPEEETQAQAYFDREVVKIEEGLEEVYAYRDKRRSEKAQGGI